MDETARPSVGAGIRGVMERMERLRAGLGPGDARRHFHTMYIRTTKAFAEELRTGRLGGFEDPEWVERFDVAFAELYMDPFERWQATGTAPGPWEVVFATARDRPNLQALRHVLFGMNVHVNFDLPQALLATITDQEFDDPQVRARRNRDHVHSDRVLVSRVAAEDRALEGRRSLTDRLLTPLNRRATRRFLPEAREKVWRNAVALSMARREGPEALAARIDELAGLCSDRVSDLIAPGQVLLKLSRRGFGVVLPGA
jgi:Family of unknown function (DUF5995)